MISLKKLLNNDGTVQIFRKMNNTDNLITCIKHNFFRMTFIIRTLSILSIALYIIFFYQVLFEWYAYTLKYFIAQFFVYLTYGIVCNFGLFFITTEKAKKMKVWSTIFYLPSIFITPLIIGAFQSYYTGIFIIFLIFILIYVHFNPWKNSG